jgi:tetratricopeptide (TPR) repeat protein
MTLAFSGVPVTPSDLVAEVYTPGRKGTLQNDLVAAARRRDRVAYAIHGMEELEAELSAGHPVLVLQNLALGWLPKRHYAVVIGRSADGAFILHSGQQSSMLTGAPTFRRTWEREGAWGLLVLRPDDIAASASELAWVEGVAGLEQAGRFEAAQQGYRATLRRWPRSLAARIGLANAAFAAGHIDLAEATLRDAVGEHPLSGTAWNNLAHVLAAAGRWGEARRAAVRAVELGGPESSTYEATRREIEERRQRANGAGSRAP